MMPSALLLFTAWGLAMGLLGGGTVAVLRVQGRQDRFRARVARTAGPFQRGGSAIALPQGSGVGLAQAAEGLGPALASIFGFDPRLQDHYALRWWVALLLTLGIAAVAVKLVGGIVGPLALLGLPFAWVVLSRMFFSWCEGRRRERLFLQFPDALAMIVRAVRVGIPVTDAIRSIGRDLEAPTGPEFARLSDELAIGLTLESALKAMAERNGLQEYRFFATALSLQSQTGGGLSETLETLADVIRKRVAVRQKGQALSAEAKMSSLVLGTLPLLAGAALWVMNAAYITVLFTDPMGQKIFAAAVLTLGSGVLTMRTLIRKSLT